MISGLQALKTKSDVEVVTDSTYVAKGCSEWMTGWKRNGWRRKDGSQWKPVKNAELWQQLDEQVNRHEVKWQWVRGHNGHPGNERADDLANRGVDEVRGMRQA